MARLGLALILVPLCSCSLLLTEGSPEGEPNEPDPDECPTSSAARRDLFEGQGATVGGIETRALLIPIESDSALPTQSLFLHSPGGLPIRLRSSRIAGNRGFISVEMDVSEDDAIGPISEDLTLFEFFETAGGCINIPITYHQLPELTLADDVSADALGPRYSKIVIDSTSFLRDGSGDASLTSMSTIEFRGDLSATGEDADTDVNASGLAGPGGTAGGPLGGDAAHPTAGGKGTVNGGGGAGGHAFPGDSGPGGAAGGDAIGNRLLQNAGATRGGHGGGGCADIVGAGGGGAVLLHARGPIVLTNDAVIDARGGLGNDPAVACPAGGASAGSVFLSATDLVGTSGTGERLTVKLGPSIEPMMGTKSSGGRLLVKIPTQPVIGNLESDSTSSFSGATLSTPTVSVVDTNMINLTVFGSRDGLNQRGIISAVQFAGASSMPNEVFPAGEPPEQISFLLVAGLNRLCVIDLQDVGSVPDPADGDVALSCVEVGYLP